MPPERNRQGRTILIWAGFTCVERHHVKCYIPTIKSKLLEKRREYKQMRTLIQSSYIFQ